MSSNERRGSNSAFYATNSKTPYPVFQRFHSFKEFVSIQRDHLEPTKALELYERYRHDFKVYKTKDVFKNLQCVGFVMDRYSPEGVKFMCERKATVARRNADLFMQELIAGNFSGIKLDYQFPAGAQLFTVPYEYQRSFVVASTSVENTPPKVKASGDPVEEHPSDDDVVMMDRSYTHLNGMGQLNYFNFNEITSRGCLMLTSLPAETRHANIVSLCADLEDHVLDITLIPACETVFNWMAQNAEHESHGAVGLLSDTSRTRVQPPPQAGTFLESPNKSGYLLPRMTAYIEFVSDDAAARAEIALEKRTIPDVNVPCHPVRVPCGRPVRVTVHLASLSSSRPERRSLDLANCTSLIKKYDDEFFLYDPRDIPTCFAGSLKKGSEDPDPPGVPACVKSPLFEKIGNLPEQEQLDLMILYLRRVHYIDYYHCLFCWTERELYEVCGPATFRLSLGTSEATVVDMSPELGLSFNQEHLSEVQKSISNLQSMDLERFFVDIVDGHPALENPWKALCESKTLTVDAEKFRCSLCRKLFKGVEFVHKHIKNKHEADFLSKLVEDVKTELMDDMYEYDPFKLLLFVSSISREAYPTALLPALKPPRLSTGGEPLNSFSAVKNRSRKEPDRRDVHPYRDWDAPRSRAAERLAGGDMRLIVKYDDI